MTTIEIKARNNADAVRLGNGQVAIPGCGSSRHLGRKDVKIESFDLDTTKAWLDDSYLVASYSITE